MAIVGDEESQSRSLCCCSSGGGRRGSGAVAGPAVEQGVQGLDDDAHVGAELTLVLHAQGGHSSHLVYIQKQNMGNMVRVISSRFVFIFCPSKPCNKNFWNGVFQ